MITSDQLKDIKERTAARKQYLSIDEKIIQVEEEQLRTQAPGFWDDAKAAEAQMKKVKALQAWIDGYKEVNNCAKSLYTWYHSRFVDHRNDPEFKFSIKYLPKWVSEFIIVYGYQYDCSNSEHFISEIQKWSSSLHSKSSKYAIPYSIYEFEHSESPPENYTIASLVINDILMEEILYKLSKPESPNLAVNLDCNDVTSIIQQNNDSLFAVIRTRLTHQSELIEQLGFTKTVGHIDE